ncbi:MAG TPA: chromosome segregation protein SMC [Actinomycetota bacterium]|nr:chromosome segregation protein SMC [Actinomycetota bacterium]
MFLKTLTLRGFKSFADRTTLALEPGISVIVGPNGSGKSNLIDAISWVLGEQGPRSLRGGRMEDVIFAGSPHRPALAMTEVCLTIDNSAGRLPLEFSEVTIARTLFRSGESEYRLNGQPCRLLDVREVLSDTGIGREQHTIIGQGQLDELLTADATQVRSAIEEAAGIAKHRRRKERALRRIAAADANLVRLGDVLSEVRRLLRPLREQAELAQRHAAMVDELERVRVVTGARELFELRQALGPAGDRDLEAPIRALEREVQEVETALEAAGSGRQQAAVRREAAREVAWSLNRLVDRCQALARLAHERERTLEAELAGITEAGAQARLDELARELAAAQPALDEATEAAEAAEARAADRLAARTAAEAALAQVQERLAPLRAAQREAQAETVKLRGELAAGTAALEAAQREQARAAERRGVVDGARQSAAAVLEESTAALAALEDAEAPEMEALAELEDRLEAATAERQAALDALGEAEREAATWRARAQVRAGASPREVRRLASMGLEGVLGVLADLVEVPEESKAALEALVGPASSVLVVADPAAAERVLTAAGGGEPLGLLIGDTRVEAGFAGDALVELVAPNDEHGESALGGVYVAGSTEEAARLAAERPDVVFVTLAGVMATGRLLVRTSAAAAARAAQAEAVLSAARDRLSGIDAAIAERRRAAEVATATLNKADADIAAAIDRAASAERELHALEREAAVLVEADHRGSGAIASLAARLAELRVASAAADQRAEAAGRDVHEHADEQGAAARVRSEAGAAYDEARLVAARAAERWRLLVERCSELRAAGEEAAERAAAIGGLRAELAARLERARTVGLEASGLVRAAGEWLAEAEERHVLAGREAGEAEALVGDLQARRSAQSRQLERLREEARAEDLSRAELRIRGRIVEEQLAAGERDVEGLVARFGRRLEEEDPSLLQDPWDRTAASATEVLARRQARLERDLAGMGRVNPLAAVEFEALSEREQFLTEQIADVKSSRRDLFKVVAGVDERIHELFGTAFADVAREYEQVFAALFPGGSGRLRLTDPANPLETGVEVEAKPGGKSLRRLSLLSGGERALAGLALAFAIFRARPSPFYVLDEVEAALDDVNLHRFLGLLQDFRGSSQLIVVTHQKRTMEVADVLYGVSVRSDGASRVISERLSAPPGVGGHQAGSGRVGEGASQSLLPSGG